MPDKPEPHAIQAKNAGFFSETPRLSGTMRQRCRKDPYFVAPRGIEPLFKV